MKISRFRNRRPGAKAHPPLPRAAPGARVAPAESGFGVGARPEPDATLAERARTLWQYGDWDGLAGLAELSFDGHPARAKLALLVATALFQTGRAAAAEQFVAQAVAWGCPQDVVARALLAGAVNSLGRLHALRGRDELAVHRFRRSLELGFPGSDHPQTLQARQQQQYRQLDLTGAPTSVPAVAAGPAPDGRYGLLDALIAEGRLQSWRPDDAPAQTALLEALCAALAAVLGRDDATKLVLSIAQTPRGELRLLHVAGDYIPQKILRENSFYEAEFLQILEQFHEPDTLFLDVGANIGNHTLYFARQPGLRVVAFEPEPHNALCLAANLALNGVVDAVRVHRVALGAQNGEVQLGMAIAQNFGSFSGHPAANPNNRPELELPVFAVPVRTLDEVLASEHPGQPIGTLKIDVEGMEFEVLRGAAETLARWRPLVAVECFHVDDYRRIETLLAPLGYDAIALCNATPTFVFVSDARPFHGRRLLQHLRQGALTAAAKRQGFAAAAAR